MNQTVKFFSDLIKKSEIDPANPGMMEMFGDRKYKFGVFLINADGKLFKIARTAIDELYIVDDLMDCFHHGHIIFNNPKDVLERSTKIYTQNNSIDVTPYRFRNDARDFLYVTMDPYLETSTGESVSEEINSIVHSLRFLFCIHEMQDVTTQSGPNDKKTKLIFHDYRLQQLVEKNSFYSTAKTPAKIGENRNVGANVQQLNNTERGKPTGEIIQDILVSTLQEPDTDGMFSRHWEFGDQSMFYTSPVNSKAYDDLLYVLDRHVSSEERNHEPCILKLERYTDRWELLPLSMYFERAHYKNGPGAYQSERFILDIDMDTISTGSIPPASKTYVGATDPLINYSYTDLSTISDYTFSEMNGSDCQHILNSSVIHRYDEANKTFSIDLEQTNIKTIRDMFQDRYVSHMKGGDAGQGFTAWLTDETRETNRNITSVDSWTPNKTLGLQTRNKKLLSALLLGNGIQFNVKGDSSRRSGVWISLDMDQPYEDTDYEKKVLGQYFVVRTEHRVTSTDYVNNIIGVKPYYFENPNFAPGDIFTKDTEKVFEAK